MRKCFSWVCAMAFCALFAGCGQKQVVATGPKYANPYAAGFYSMDSEVESYDDENYFAATGIAAGNIMEEGNLQIAALENAKEIVYRKVKHAVEGSTKSFFERFNNSKGNDYNNHGVGGFDAVIRSVINDVQTRKQKTSGVDEQGNCKVYAAIKISKKVVADAVANQLSKSDKAEIRALHEDFRKQMAEDLKAYTEGN
ncbi:MAG: hypothetical protein HUK03_02970 [Bacteroidaceae bacterium]|nr:hypothetical protein [Bacteroidaceae bacterium]